MNKVWRCQASAALNTCWARESDRRTAPGLRRSTCTVAQNRTLLLTYYTS